MAKVSVILPTFNESKNIGIMLDRLDAIRIAAGLDLEVIVVDDNSPDETWKRAQELASTQFPYVRVIRRVHAKGLSSAVLDGFAASQADYLFVMDADLQHDEKILPKMIEKLASTADVVLGSRKVEGGGMGEWSKSRRFVSWGATKLAHIVLRVPVTDPMSGFFGIRREIFEKHGQEINPKGFKILLEFVFRARNCRVQEVGYVFQNRIHGESKLSTGVMLDYIEALVDMRLAPAITSTFIMYCCVGAGGIFVNLCASFLALKVLGTSSSTALMVGIATSIIFNFAANNSITFRRCRISWGRQWIVKFVQFASICTAGAFINFSISERLMALSIGNFYWASGLGMLVALFWNYFINVGVTWNRQTA
jgi:dolichol-phosphate mannosyltransferase